MIRVIAILPEIKNGRLSRSASGMSLSKCVIGGLIIWDYDRQQNLVVLNTSDQSYPAITLATADEPRPGVSVTDVRSVAKCTLRAVSYFLSVIL